MGEGKLGYICIYTFCNTAGAQGIDWRGTEIDGPKQLGSGWGAMATGQVTDWGRGSEVMLYLQACYPQFRIPLVVAAQGLGLRVLWRQTGSPRHCQVAEQP